MGSDAYSYLAREHLLVSALSTMLKTPREDLVDRVGSTVEKLKNAERELARLKQQAMMSNIDAIIGEGQQIGSFRVWTLRAPEGTDAKQLREIALTGIRKAPTDVPAAVLASAVVDARVSLIATVNQAAQDRGCSPTTCSTVPAQRRGPWWRKKDAAQGEGEAGRDPVGVRFRRRSCGDCRPSAPRSPGVRRRRIGAHRSRPQRCVGHPRGSGTDLECPR